MFDQILAQMEAIYARHEESFEFGRALLWPVAYVIRDLMKEEGLDVR
jgi:hypothetical protein